MSLPELSVRRPVGVGVLMAAVGIAGAVALGRLPIQLLPDLELPRLVIHVAYPDAAPQEVERAITERVEAVLAGLPGLEAISSRSWQGTSLVDLRFGWGADMDFAMLDVRERLDRLAESLPPLASRPNVLRTDPSEEPVMTIAVGGMEDLRALRRLASDVIRRRLEQLPGVARAEVTGGLEREVRVVLDPARVEAFGLEMDQIERALADASAIAPGGSISRAQLRIPLRTLGEFTEAEEIAEVVVGTTTPGAAVPRRIRIRDVGLIDDGWAPRESMTFLDGRESVGIQVHADAGANEVRVAQEVETVLGELGSEYPHVRLDVAHSQAGFISEAIDQVQQALSLGALFSFLVLFVFLGDPRYPLLIAAAIPISLSGSLTLLDLAGVSLNLMSMGGLALGVGMLVDNSIVVLENVVRHRESGVVASVAAAAGATEVQGAITASTLTTIAVFAPIAYVDGLAGALFRDLAVAVACSLTISLLVALTLLPAVAARFGVGNGSQRRSGRLDHLHHRLVTFVRARRPMVLAAFLAVVGAGTVGAWILPRTILSPIDEGIVDLRVMLPSGTPITATSELALSLDSLMRDDPDVQAVFTAVGREAGSAQGPETGSGSGQALLRARLRNGASAKEVAARLAARVEPIAGGASLELRPGRASVLGGLLGFGHADVEVHVRGRDLGVMQIQAQHVTQRLAGLPMLSNVGVRGPSPTTYVRVELQAEAVAAFGLATGGVVREIERTLRGVRVTELVDFDRRIPVILLDGPQADRTREDLAQLRISGIPLGQLAEIRSVDAPGEVRREGRERVVAVQADLVRGGLDRALDAVDEVLEEVDAGPGVRLEMSGGRKELEHSFRSLQLAFVLAAGLVYLILAAQFDSLLRPFLVIGSIPPAVAGAIGALAITGRGLDTMGLIGIVVLVGVVVNDAIMKVDFIEQRRRAGMLGAEAVLEATRARFRPVVMTTATTICGLLPMALGLGAGSSLRSPLAIALIGGLFVGTLYTLFAIPALQLRHEVPEGRRLFQARGARAATES